MSEFENSISIEEIKNHFPDAKPGQYLCYLHTLYRDHNWEVVNEDLSAVNISDDIDEAEPSDYTLEQDEFYTIHVLTK